MRNTYGYIKSNELSGYCIVHHGILGMKWGVRRYQNEDGSLTEKGKKRYLQNQDWEYSHLNKRGQKSLLIDQEAYGKYVVGKMEEDSQKEREEEYNQRVKDGEKLLKDADVLTNPDFSNERTKDAIDFLISGYMAYGEPELKSLFKHRKEYSNEEFADRLLSKDSGKAMVAMADLWIQGYSIPDIKAMVTYSSSSGNGILSKMPKTFLNGLSKREKDNSTSLGSFIEEADIEYGGNGSIRDKEKVTYKNLKHSALSGYCIAHHGIKGQKWGIRRYQNADGSLTAAGKQRYTYANVKKYHNLNKVATGIGIAGTAAGVAGLALGPATGGVSVAPGVLVGGVGSLTMTALGSIANTNISQAITRSESKEFKKMANDKSLDFWYRPIIRQRKIADKLSGGDPNVRKSMIGEYRNETVLDDYLPYVESNKKSTKSKKIRNTKSK